MLARRSAALLGSREIRSIMCTRMLHRKETISKLQSNVFKRFSSSRFFAATSAEANVMESGALSRWQSKGCKSLKRYCSSESTSAEAGTRSSVGSAFQKIGPASLVPTYNCNNVFGPTEKRNRILTVLAVAFSIYALDFVYDAVGAPTVGLFTPPGPYEQEEHR